MPLSTTSSYVTAGPVVLQADVPNGGTVTVPYPSGFAQADFTGANAGNATDNMVVFRSSGDKYTGSQVGLTFGASNVTVTNNSGVTWPASAPSGAIVNAILIGLPRIDPVQRYNGPKALI